MHVITDQNERKTVAFDFGGILYSCVRSYWKVSETQPGKAIQCKFYFLFIGLRYWYSLITAWTAMDMLKFNKFWGKLQVKHYLINFIILSGKCLSEVIISKNILLLQTHDFHSILYLLLLCYYIGRAQ